MTGWLRRNAIALLVIALVAPAFAYWVVRPRYDEYANVTHPVPDITVAPGQSVDLRGIRWSVKETLREHKSRGYSDKNAVLPKDTEIIRVLWERTNLDHPQAPTACSASLIAGPVRWERQKSGYTVNLDGVTSQLDNVYMGPPGTATSCYEPELWGDGFLVPKGTKPDAADIRIQWGKFGADGYQVVRFQLTG